MPETEHYPDVTRWLILPRKQACSLMGGVGPRKQDGPRMAGTLGHPAAPEIGSTGSRGGCGLQRPDEIPVQRACSDT